MQKESLEYIMAAPDGQKRPDYLGHRKRLMERYLKGGIDAFAEYEAVELLLSYVMRYDVKPQAKRLIAEYKNVQGVFDCSYDKLLETKGIGSAAALLIKLVKDICSLYLREKQLYKRGIYNSYDIIDYLRSTVGHMEDERFMAVFLNSVNEVLGESVISDGVIDHAVVYPRKIFEKAFRYKAKSIILVHNHPAGSLNPSPDDIKLTRTLKNAADLLDMRIFDHIIVTTNGYASFLERGLL